MGRQEAFRALADPTRRRILELLADGELAAGDIAQRFPIAFPSVSHHLAVLRAAGLVGARRLGRHVRYRIDPVACRDVIRYLTQLTSERGGG